MRCENCRVKEGFIITWLDVWGENHMDTLCESCMLAWYDEIKEALATTAWHSLAARKTPDPNRDNLVNVYMAIRRIYYGRVLDKVVNGE